MAEQTITVSNTERTMYDVTFGTNALGGLQKVSPNLELLLDPVRIGSLGKMKLDERVCGLADGANVMVILQEGTRGTIEKLFPWFSGSSGADIDLLPAIGSLLVGTDGASLTLHPRHMGSDLTKDIHLYRTYPRQGLKVERDNTQDDVWAIEFGVYPDLTKLNAGQNPYGIIGAP